MQSKHFTLKWSWANRPIGMPDRPQTMNTPSYNMCTLARALIYFVPRKCSIRFNIIVFYAVHMTLVGAGALTLRIHSYSLRDGRSIANVLFVCCISRSSLTNLFSLFLLFHIFSLFLPRFLCVKCRRSLRYYAFIMKIEVVCFHLDGWHAMRLCDHSYSLTPAII